MYQMVHAARNPQTVDSAPRDRLLKAAIEYVAAQGVSDLTLRELASAIGTSHRMLIYHFGSKEGLLVAIVQAVEAAQRQFFAEFASDPNLSQADAARIFWRRVSDPGLWPNERLFFELYGQALQGRPGTAAFLDNIIDSWVEPMTDYGAQHGLPRATARADARLGVAVVRGLLLDLLATRDHQAVDEAFERYVGLYDTSAR